MTKPTKDIEYVAFEKKCIDFNKEFYCPHCNKRIFLVCVNLGMFADGSFYCVGHNFPEDCSSFGCPKYGYSGWESLENYRRIGVLIVERPKKNR